MKTSRKKSFEKRPDAGFSLLELLLVVVIVTILAAITLPSMVASKRAANENVVKSKLVAAGGAELTFRTLLGKRRYTTIAELQTTVAGGAPLLTSADVTVSGWTFSEVTSSVTATTFGLRAVPTAENPRSASFVIFEDQVLRRCARNGPWTRSCAQITE